MSFCLHPQLEHDCARLGVTETCDVLLLNDRQFIWLILVPQRANISEAYQLKKEDQLSLSLETNLIGQRLMEHYKGDKLNIGALGNLVPQLHMHILVRFKGDTAWPKPAWGNYQAQPYADDELKVKSAEVREVIASLLVN